LGLYCILVIKKWQLTRIWNVEYEIC
jgi:hypothetical protein